MSTTPADQASPGEGGDAAGRCIPAATEEPTLVPYPSASRPGAPAGTVSCAPPGGRYYGVQVVRLACATPGARIRYTLDESEPTAASPEYGAELRLQRSCTVRARAFLDGLAPGPLASERFDLVASDVSSHPPPGAYAPPLVVYLSCPAPGAEIRYTLDGGEPGPSTPRYDPSGISMAQSAALRARAVLPGGEQGPVLLVEYAVESPRWKTLEPADRSDPVEHEHALVVPDLPGWRLFGASVRGKLHAHRGLWREDAFRCGVRDGWHLLIVADGAGSSRLSRVGSNLACATMHESLDRHLDGYAIPVRDPAAKQPDDSDLLRIKALLIQGVRSAMRALQREAQQRQISLHELSSTLLAVVHTTWNGRDLVSSIQIGDGVIALSSDPIGLTLLGDPDSGEYSGETRFLTTSGVDEDLDRRVRFVLRDRMQALVAMTDGVADDFFPAPQQLPGLLATLLARVARAEHPQQDLTDWMRYDKKGSSDDRTLTMLARVEDS